MPQEFRKVYTSCLYRMVVEFTTTCAISVYHHKMCEFESRIWRGVNDTALQLPAGRWFSLGTPVCFTSKTDCHDITEILLKVALNTITLTMFPWCNRS